MVSDSRTRLGAQNFDLSCPDVGYDAFEGAAGAQTLIFSGQEEGALRAPFFLAAESQGSGTRGTLEGIKTQIRTRRVKAFGSDPGPIAALYSCPSEQTRFDASRYTEKWKMATKRP